MTAHLRCDHLRIGGRVVQIGRFVRIVPEIEQKVGQRSIYSFVLTTNALAQICVVVEDRAEVVVRCERVVGV